MTIERKTHESQDENGDVVNDNGHRREKAIQQLHYYSKTLPLSEFDKKKIHSERENKMEKKLSGKRRWDRRKNNNVQRRLKAQYTCEFDHSHATDLSPHMQYGR